MTRPSYRSLGFYIKYSRQMDALYGNSDKAERKRLLEMPSISEHKSLIGKVGDHASEQAVELLRQCATEIEKRFRPFCNSKIRTTPKKMENEWFAEVRLWPKGGRRRTTIRWTVGVVLHYWQKDPAMSLFIWTRGGRSAEESLSGLLGGNRAQQPGLFGSGTVVFGAVPIKVCPDFQLDSESILAGVKKSLALISKNDVAGLFKI